MKLIPSASTFVGKSYKQNSNPRSSIHSLDLVITIIVFVLIGRGIDAWLNTLPIFTITIGALGTLGSFLSAYYRYQEASRREEAGKVWTRETKKETPQIAQESSDEIVVPKGYGLDD